MKKDQSWQEAGTIYQGKKNYFQRLMADSKFKLLPSSGSYYLLMDYSQLSNEPDSIFAERLVKEYGIATLPISSFQHEKANERLLRICFAKPNQVLEDAANKLKAVKVSATINE